MYVPISKDASAKNWQLKRDIVKRSRLGLVSPSRWLLEMIESTLPLGEDLRARVIPNGVDTSVFHPGDKGSARQALNLPPDATILLATAELLNDNPFKDFRTLREAMRAVAADRSGRLVLVALGEGRAIEPIPGVEAIGVPFIADPKRVALHYQAADVYVHAARAENLPLTIIEAMACGVAVVATDVGGIPELVVDGETGYLVSAGDVIALARSITSLLDEPFRRDQFGSAGAERARNRFSLRQQADAYLGLYAELSQADRARANS
jgi:glycosyltransferase involved in cell wall biosynthesis